MTKTLKLYVWRGVLCDYSCGLAFAIAYTKLQALKIVLKDEYPKKGDVYTSWAYKELTSIEPDIYPLDKISPMGEYVSGGG